MEFVRRLHGRIRAARVNVKRDMLEDDKAAKGGREGMNSKQNQGLVK